MLRAALFTFVLSVLVEGYVMAGVVFNREFAPQEGLVAPPEKPVRKEMCLNGFWQFQPVTKAQDSDGIPALTAYKDGAWESVPIKIPSPWNVNSFSGLEGGDFRSYPSYPDSWEQADMGWLRKTVRIPSDWQGMRTILHFGAIAGDCEVRVNGQVVARQFDTFMPLSTDVTDAVKWDAENEILVGVRKPSLFNVSGKLGHLTYPTGSFWGEHIAGIWQDVFLVAVPEVHIDDVFVKPSVSKDTLGISLRLKNHSKQARKVTIAGKVHKWQSLAGKDATAAPEPKWRLDGNTALEIDGVETEIPAGGETVVEIKQAVKSKLDLWSPESPNLYGLVLQLDAGAGLQDIKYTRFGWREFKIEGNKFLLNGKPIQLFGDSWHFMGVPQMTRRYAWSWYRMLKDANANAVRLHAQPFPEFYLDVADEVGMLVLDESAVWASHCSFNYDVPETWDRFSSHLERLVLRDRNHPSVFGWSIANEIIAALGVKRASAEVMEQIIDKFAGIAARVRELDPTRDWVSSDGDEDMTGKLPVVIAHYGDAAYYERLAQKGKPLGVGEAGCGYYGNPSHVSAFNGDRAYESFEGRMEGVAIEAYELLAKGQRPYANYCSIFNLAWYGLEPLPLGLKDTTRPSELKDGIMFGDYVEGKPGMQPERLGPYTTTFNPGYDPGLPLYKPWALFDAVKAAFAPGKPAKSPWDHRPRSEPDKSGKTELNIDKVAFVGDRSQMLAYTLLATGVPVMDTDESGNVELMVVDGASIKMSEVRQTSKLAHEVLARGGTVLIWGLKKETLPAVNKLLPAPAELTTRQAVSMVHVEKSPVANGISLGDLYFAEVSKGNVIMDGGIGGPILAKGRTLLEACNTDWRKWNNRGENYKTGSVVRSEREAKPSGAALVEITSGSGRILLCNVQGTPYTPQHVQLVRKLMSNMGVKLMEPKAIDGGVFDASGTVKKALVCGSFGASDYNAALETDFLKGETTLRPRAGDSVGEVSWKEEEAGDDGVFDFNRLKSVGPDAMCAAYLSFWVFSPRPLDQLLAQPDVPRVDLIAGSDDGARIWLNGKLICEEKAIQPLTADQYRLNSLPLKQGWNHFLVKVAQATGAWRFTARLQCSDLRYLAELKSAINAPEE